MLGSPRSPASFPTRAPLARARATLPSARTAQRQLAPGVAVSVSGHAFLVKRALGTGSFGTVWGARGADGAAVAIKEIACSDRAELARAVSEGQLLRAVRQEVLSAGGAQLARRVPAVIATDIEALGNQGWRLRLVMSEVRGRPLDEVLRAYREAGRLRGATDPCERRKRLIEACRCASEMVVQLAPLLEAFTDTVCHRDITPRNIQVAGLDAGRPQFGLVDFGLAVDMKRWRDQEACVDLSGDGQYWPSSAWFVFGNGTDALQQHPRMEEEFRTYLDTHSFGLTSLRCLVDMLPNLDAVDEGGQSASLDEALLCLRDIRDAWNQYWADAHAMWQPLFDAFRGIGTFGPLRAEYARVGMHRIVRDDVRAMQLALRRGRAACSGLPPATGLSGMSQLFDAILAMLQCSEEGQVDAPSARAPACASKAAGASRASSTSTATPDASPTASVASPTASVAARPKGSCLSPRAGPKARAARCPRSTM